MNRYVTLNKDVLVRLRQNKALSQDGLSYACQKRGLPLSIATIKRAEAGKAILYRSAKSFAEYFACKLSELKVGGMIEDAEKDFVDFDQRNDVPASQLFGRDFELQLFKQTLLSCDLEKKGRLLCIRGGAGIGKTKLLETFCAISQAALCPTYKVDIEQSQGNKSIFFTLLLQVVSDVHINTPHELFDKICQATKLNSAEQFFLSQLLDIEPPSLDGPSKIIRNLIYDSARVFTKLLRVCHPDKTIVIVFEDIHWASEFLLMSLKGLSAEIYNEPILMVISTRLENDPIDTIWRSGLINTPMNTLDLSPLSRSDAMSMAREYGNVEPDYLENIFHLANGNPFFLKQLLFNYPNKIGCIPATIQELIETRLSTLNERSLRLAKAASVIGDEVDVDLLEYLLQIKDLDFNELIASQIICSLEVGYVRFYHTLIRQGIYESIEDHEKRELHDQVAKWLFVKDKRLCAQHLALAKSYQASRAFLVAAEEALSKHNFGVALSQIDSALLKANSLHEKFQFLSVKGLILNKFDLPEQALRYFSQAEELADSAKDLCEISLHMASTYILLRRDCEAKIYLDKAESQCLGELRRRLLYLRSQIDQCHTLKTVGLIDHCDKLYDQRQIKDIIKCFDVPEKSLIKHSQSDRSIKVGVLHSQTGPLKELEFGVIRTTLIAIGEINESGGLLGHQIEPFLVDGKSDKLDFYRGARNLLDDASVAVVFGSSTSSNRRYIRHLFEDGNRLLVYPFQYEGIEQSENVFYIGPAPNQTALPAVEWLFSQNKRRLMLIGSDYVYPVVINSLIKQQLEEWELRTPAEFYKPLGCTFYGKIIENIKQYGPDAIILTLVGLESNKSFFQQLYDSGIKPGDINIVSLVLSENDLSAIPREHIEGTYSLFAYFQNFDNPVNAQFVRRYKAIYGIEQQIGGYMESAYMGVYLWAKGVQKAGSFETDKVRAAMRGMAHYGPGGIACIDEHNNHTWRHVQLARVNSTGEFEIVWRSDKPIKPEPFPKGDSVQWENRLQQMKQSRWDNDWELLCDGQQCKQS